MSFEAALVGAEEHKFENDRSVDLELQDVYQTRLKATFAIVALISISLVHLEYIMVMGVQC